MTNPKRPSPPKHPIGQQTINQALAEKIGRDFARERKLAMDDPIVKNLIQGCKMSFGATNYRNRIKYERIKDQMVLLKLPERSDE